MLLRLWHRFVASSQTLITATNRLIRFPQDACEITLVGHIALPHQGSPLSAP